MAQPQKFVLANYTNFVEKELGFKVFLDTEGDRPDKIFEVCTHEAAKQAAILLRKLHITNWVLFSAGHYKCFVVLQITAFLTEDLIKETGVDPAIYVEDKIAYIAGKFPGITSKFDKEEWKAFAAKVNNGNK